MGDVHVILHKAENHERIRIKLEAWDQVATSFEKQRFIIIISLSLSRSDHLEQISQLGFSRKEFGFDFGRVVHSRSSVVYVRSTGKRRQKHILVV